MQLNAEDGGKRQCILCTNNENGICENVTYESNKRVINGYTKPNGDFIEGLHDNNLRYYRTDFVGRSRTMHSMQRLVNLSTDMLCIKENLYTEQKEMGGMKVHPQIFRYFDDGKFNLYDTDAKKVVLYHDNKPKFDRLLDLALDLDLSVDEERPIILIGGSNGGGKTTLFEAISGALYGLRIENREHFMELLNQGATGKVKPEIPLEITFSGKVLGREPVIAVKS